jgi:competence protein ComEA
MSKLAIFVLLFLASLQAQSSGTIPDGEGMKEFKKVCATCHPAEQVVGRRRTEKGWEQSIEEMIARGAKGTDEELEKIVVYLTANFGKVNVNAATSQEMQKTLGFSEKDADAIVAYRQKNGKIKDFEQLTKIPGVNVEKLQEKRGWIAFDL